MALMTIMLIACCDDGPSQKTDYGKLKLGRLDIKDAVSLGLSTESSSRAIDGEFLSAGLYKIDAAGNITAVGVYFTTDTLGNKLEHEEKLKVVPEKIFDLSENYIYLMHCDYYDSDGDHVEDRWEYDYDDNSYLVKQDVPYKDLLVRKSDGKIWCIDNIPFLMTEWDTSKGDFILRVKFKEDRYGTLYLKQYSDVYKFNLNDDSSSFEQITNNSSPYDNGDFLITDNGVVCAYYSYNSSAKLSWPHSGFQSIDYNSIFEDINDLERTIPSKPNLGDHSLRLDSPYDLYNMTFENYNNSLIVFFSCRPKLYNGKGRNISWSDIIFYYTKDKIDLLDESLQESNWPFGFFYTINIGTSPGSAALCDNPIQLTGLPEDSEVSWSKYLFERSHQVDHFSLFSSAYIGTNYILTYGVGGWISKIDLDKREWKWLKKLDFYINFSNSISYDGKVWDIDGSREHFGAYWFDPVSLEDGFVKFNVDKPSFIDTRKYQNGKITYSGTDPATGHNVTIVIDLTTGEAVSDESAPDLLFQNLINLN